MRWVALMLAAAAGSCLAAEELTFEVQRFGARIDVRASAVVRASPAVVWSTLNDFERLPQFIPGVSSSVVQSRQGGRLIVDQVGEARFLFFTLPLEVRLEVTQSPPDWVASRSVRGNVRRMTGHYDIAADAARGTVLVRYYGDIEPGFDLPPLVGMAALRSTVEEQFNAMIAEIERRAAAAK
jgi:carbon monoxide dehydrogenase subunit G